ncbi:RNA polymerase sigma factor [Nonomuraea spiralis]|uniref:RNA polymerase sigma factor n=1 Tax=Nonomuraea spiralis TaxID=46182 RepID=A0ABV5IJS3_9ACTN|nr:MULTISPECIES: RNA polymerase sigma factor [Nonomuraea]RSN05752.1 RNA polymerase subunit sigma-70 [Nonomuraea sp. WAC 01424]GGT08108.1 DNA-directed RNA polymerase sigma-70 factor [Nonomuraea spiralis]
MATPPGLTGPPDLRADWEEIFTAHFAEIHRYIARRLSADVADDTAAEVFLAAYRGGYDPSRGAVRPWLYGIATHLIARHHRSELRKWKALGRMAEREEHSHEDATLARVAASGLTGRLAGALAGLKRRDRDVVLLHALGGLSHAEVAAALDIPAGTVASRLNRARGQLRKALGDVNPLEDNRG